MEHSMEPVVPRISVPQPRGELSSLGPHATICRQASALAGRHAPKRKKNGGVLGSERVRVLRIELPLARPHAHTAPAHHVAARDQATRGR